MLFRRSPRPHSRALRDELQSLCHRAQLDALNLPAHLRRDIGLDCGCVSPAVRDRPPFT